MTAINLLCLPDAVHLFTDAGHFLNDRDLASLGGKVIALPRWNAVAVFHGPSLGGPLLRSHLERAQGGWHGAVLDAAARIEGSGALGGRPFSVIAAGHNGKQPFGLAVEEGGRNNNLSVGSVVKALPCEAQFDQFDVIGSGVRMMEEQRQKHGVVAGWCDYTKVTARGIEGPRQVRRWDDVVVPEIGALASAKIGDLEVDTVNIAENAVTGVNGQEDASGTGTCAHGATAANPMSLPVQLFWSVTLTSSGGINMDAKVYRTSDNHVFYHRTEGGSYSFSIASAAVDHSAGTNEEYRFEIFTSPSNDPRLSWENYSFGAVWVTR